MCSVPHDEQHIVDVTPLTGSAKHYGPCMQCGEKPVVVIRTNEPYCRSCFQVYCTHKFRSAFGKTKCVRDGEKALVAFSGGAASSAILHLVQEGLSRKAQKKLRFIPMAVYIDEGGVTGQSLDERRSVCKHVCEKLEERNMSGFVTSIEMIFHMDDDSRSSDKRDDRFFWSVSDGLDKLYEKTLEKKSNLEDVFLSAQTITAKEDLLRRFRHDLLVRVARDTGCSKVLLGNTTTRLAVRLISNVAQGRGSQIPLDVNFADERYSDVVFVRPMREFSAKDVAMYNELNQLCPIVQSTLTTKAKFNVSIDRVTEAFITGLQANFPSTVNTVFRTGEKLDEPALLNSSCCIMCQSPLDKTQTSAGSRLVEDADITHTGTLPTVRIDASHMKPLLCYGCWLVVNDLEDVNKLPSFVFKNMYRESQRQQMKEDIAEFILDDTTE